MEITSSGPSGEFVQKPKKKYIRLCITCQKVQDSQQNKKLTSTPDGRSVIIQTSRALLVELTDEDLQNIQYHVRTCYSRYKRSGARQKTTEVPKKRSNPESFIVNELSSPESRHKRRKTHTESDVRKKPCIICDKVNCKDSNERFQIEDTKRAVNFLNAYNFNKDFVYTRCILCKSAKDLFAADFMYHKSYMEGYLLQFKRNVETIVNFQEEEKNIDKEHLQVAFKGVVSSMDLKTRGYI